MNNVDVIIIGSGLAGVSAARALVKNGLSVLMIEGGAEKALADVAASSPLSVSPKLDIPSFRAGLAAYLDHYKTSVDCFNLYGQLNAGGLSRYWGLGCASFSNQEWAGLLSDADFKNIIAELSRHIGICGVHGGAMDETLGTGMELLTPPLIPKPLDKLTVRAQKNISFDAPRLAWNPANNKAYSAADELPDLKSHKNFEIIYNQPVKRFYRENNVMVAENHAGQKWQAKKILLAAGTIGSMTIAARSLEYAKPLPFQHSLNGLFLGLSWRRVARCASGDLAQLSGRVSLKNGEEGFISVYAAQEMPDIYFEKRLPMPAFLARIVWKMLKPHALIFSVFLPGTFSKAEITITADHIDIRSNTDRKTVLAELKAARNKIAGFLMPHAIIPVPFSLTLTPIGSDMHYACGMPMKANPAIMETDRNGALKDWPDVHCIDGASLPTLPAKSHSFAIMCNAMRIARLVAVT